MILPYPPSANAYWRSVRGRVVVSHEARKYKQQVKLRLLSQLRPGHKPTTCDVVLRLLFYRPRRVGDLDNSLKVLLDALKGVLFEDDSQVVEIHATRDDDKENPRVVVEAESRGMARIAVEAAS